MDRTIAQLNIRCDHLRKDLPERKPLKLGMIDLNMGYDSLVIGDMVNHQEGVL